MNIRCGGHGVNININSNVHFFLTFYLINGKFDISAVNVPIFFFYQN